MLELRDGEKRSKDPRQAVLINGRMMFFLPFFFVKHLNVLGSKTGVFIKYVFLSDVGGGLFIGNLAEFADFR